MLVRLFLLPSFSPPHDDGLAVADGGWKEGTKWRAFGGNVELRLTGWLHFSLFQLQMKTKIFAKAELEKGNLQICKIVNAKKLFLTDLLSRPPPHGLGYSSPF